MTILIATGLLREARLMAGPDIVAIAGGGDGIHLEQRLDGAIDAHPHVRALLSSGLAGALDSGLRPGDVIIGKEGNDQLIAALRRALPQALSGQVLGRDAPVATVGEKQALHLQTHAHAVDMESHIVARVSARRGLPFAVLRVISDAATDRLPPAALCGMRSDGSMAIGAVLGSLARNPIQLPALVRTAWHAQRGFRALLRCYRSVRLVDLIEHALDMP